MITAPVNTRFRCELSSRASTLCRHSTARRTTLVTSRCATGVTSDHQWLAQQGGLGPSAGSVSQVDVWQEHNLENRCG